MDNISGPENEPQIASGQATEDNPTVPQMPSIEKQNNGETHLNASEVRAHKLRGMSSRRRKIQKKAENSEELSKEWNPRKLWVDDDYKSLKKCKQKKTKRRRRPICGKPLNKRRKRRVKRRIQRTKMRMAQHMAKIPAKLLFSRKKGKVNVFEEYEINK